MVQALSNDRKGDKAFKTAKLSLCSSWSINPAHGQFSKLLQCANDTRTNDICAQRQKKQIPDY